MATVRAVAIPSIDTNQTSNSFVDLAFQIVDKSSLAFVDENYLSLHIGNSSGSYFDIVNFTNLEFITQANAALVAYATGLGHTLAATDIFWQGVVMPSNNSFNNAPGASIVTGTGATGIQISATRDAHVSYSPTMVTTASISGNASDVIVLEICSTNSATAGNWIEIGRVTNAQALSLAITLQSVQTTSGPLVGYVPAGYYRKIRAITSGTVTNSMSSGQEVLL